MPKLKPKGIGYRRRYAAGGDVDNYDAADAKVDADARSEGMQATNETPGGGLGGDGYSAGDRAALTDLVGLHDDAYAINTARFDPRTADVVFDPSTGYHALATYFDPNPLNAQTGLGSLGRTMVGGLTGLAAGAAANAAGFDSRIQLSGPGAPLRGIGDVSLATVDEGGSRGGDEGVELRTVDDRPADVPATPTQQASRIQFTPYTGDPTRYGQGPGHRFWQETPVKAAAGQPVRGIGGGQDDEIPALLSDGEYVIDATTVADIGDGSTEEGFKRLDAFRKEVRRHKGRKAETIPPKAKGIGQYLRGAD